MKRVLIVEDDHLVLKYVTHLFHHRGYKVDTTQSCSDALRLLQSAPYSLYLLDVNLRDGSGIDLCDHIRAIGGTAPIIVYSGDESNETPAIQAGANAFVPKGVLLKDRLHQVLGCFENITSPTDQLAGSIPC
jgi:DNA-binding response OmpR family regulator